VAFPPGPAEAGVTIAEKTIAADTAARTANTGIKVRALMNYFLSLFG
jgi:hypothetical protein